MVQRVAIKRDFEAGGFAMRRLENSLCRPSSKWVPFSNYGKAKVAKGEGWSPPFINCAQDTVGV